MMRRAVRTPADAILRTVRDDRHFGAIDEDPLPERPSTEPRYTRLSREKRLRLAVLREAFGTFRRCSGIEGPRARRLLAEVEAWLASDASDWPFAFVSVCETLGLDPDYIRRGIRQWAARRKAVAEQIPSRRQSESTGCRQIEAPRAVA